MNRELYHELAMLVDAIENCRQSHNDEWLQKHTERLHELCENYLPSGSGFDSGTKINIEESKPDRLVLETSYHHMSESGYYEGWTGHRVIVKPSLAFGFTLRITGRDYQWFKKYAYELFYSALHEEVER